MRHILVFKCSLFHKLTKVVESIRLLTILVVLVGMSACSDTNFDSSLAILSTSPEDGETGISVALNTAITVTFNADMDQGTITTSTFTVNGGAVGGVISYPSADAAAFTPSSELVYATTYTATITTAAADAGGSTLTEDYSWSFTTVAAETIRVSVPNLDDQDTLGGQGNNDTWGVPAISGDGRYAAFSSRASNLVLNDANGTDDIFLHDTQIGTTTIVSVSTDGAPGDGEHHFGASISGDGRYVAFHSDSSNLVSGDTNGKDDIFVRDMNDGGTIFRASLPNLPDQGILGTEGNDKSYNPSLSASGQYAAFDSLASNLVLSDGNGVRDIFRHDVDTGETILVSVAFDGTQADDRSYSASINMNSGDIVDGRYIAFVSYATNLVADDTNEKPDVFRRDTQEGITIRVNVPGFYNQSALGTEAVGDSGTNWKKPGISADGRYVVFYSEATNLVADDTNGEGDIFMYDTVSLETTRVSVASDGTQGNRSSWGPPTISADGRYVAFYSYATNLVAGDTNALGDVFVHDAQNGVTRRLVVATGGQSSDPVISADGKYVVFSSYATNLVAGDTNLMGDFFRTLF
ncbi:MAG: hypothetical protein IEMM0002_0346 [bacterium]|nr:MAG: hypothetical protein IEMM0002_0346 [bacterium]